MLPLIPTTLVGSYPQPDWLIDRDRLLDRLPPRVRAKELWRIPEPYLAQAQDDATALAIRDLERAGLDILTDGEIRRESYSNRFATALEGLDIANPAMVEGRAGKVNAVPRVVGPVRRTRPVEVDDLRFLRANTERAIKITLPGPFTMSQQAHNEAYDDPASLALDLAAAVNEEVRDLFAAGADVVQIDEPWLQARPAQAREYAVAAIDRAVEAVDGTTALHTCFGYAHIVRDRPTGYSLSVQGRLGKRGVRVVVVLGRGCDPWLLSARRRRPVTPWAARGAEREALDRRRGGASGNRCVRAGAQPYLGPRPGVAPGRRHDG
jgi:5-methyltetrahydropteroyltriglutamate--homocysteine methyltransferase